MKMKFTGTGGFRVGLVIGATALACTGCSVFYGKESFEMRWQTATTVLERPMITRHGLPFVQARVNGSEPLWFLVDSGAEGDVIHSRVAAQLNLKHSLSRMKLNRTVRAKVCKDVDFEIAGATYHTSHVSATELVGDIEKGLKIPVAGILGQGLFHSFVVEFDYARGVLRLRDPKGFQYTGPGSELPLDFVDYRPLVKGSVEVQRDVPLTGRFFLDTGADSTVELADRFLKTHGIQKSGAGVTSGRSHVLEGDVPAFSIRGEKVSLGSAVMSRPAIGLGGDETSHDGVIGSGFLQHFHVTFDYSRKRLWLETDNQSRPK
jgi:hypothetical protein